jgi:hypothetical protein
MRRRPGETRKHRSDRYALRSCALRASSHAEVEAADAGHVGRHVRDAVSALELAVVEYLGWFNTGRLHHALEDVTSVEFDALSDQRNETIRPTMIKLEPPNPVSAKPRGLIPRAPASRSLCST